MAIIPQIRCSRFATAVEFYTKILDFEYVEGDDQASTQDAAFCVLSREGDQIFLCNFDGGTRSVIAVMTADVDALFRKFRARGLQTPGDPNVPAEEVHQGPVDQTWGTREFYVQDLDGNSLRFTQVLPADAGARTEA
jgi:catechol 2,3-dioxygenase-like lactoylglutathione lyase family enzyme